MADLVGQALYVPANRVRFPSGFFRKYYVIWPTLKYVNAYGL